MSAVDVREILAACVNRGAKFMDEHHPGWHTRVNPGILKIACPSHCVLGQMFGDYGDGVKYFNLSDEQEFDFGFYNYSAASMKILTQCWRAEIISRRAHQKERIALQNKKKASRRALAIVVC